MQPAGWQNGVSARQKMGEQEQSNTAYERGDACQKWRLCICQSVGAGDEKRICG